MGITIYYSGRLRSMELLPMLINEVVHYCTLLHWEHEIIYRSFEMPIQGITFATKGSKPVWMTFLDNGLLASPDSYEWSLEVEEEISENDLEVETITHYAGAFSHIDLILMIKHIVINYFSSFSLYDESHYWETGNKSICENEFNIMQQWVDQRISKLDELDGRIGEIGEAGELVEERINNLHEHMPFFEIEGYLYTPRPSSEELTSFRN